MAAPFSCVNFVRCSGFRYLERNVGRKGVCQNILRVQAAGSLSCLFVEQLKTLVWVRPLVDLGLCMRRCSSASLEDRQQLGQCVRRPRRRHEQVPPVPQKGLELDVGARPPQRLGINVRRHLHWHESRDACVYELAVKLLSPPDGQKRTADAMPPRCC